MFDDTLDDPVRSRETTEASPTDGSQAMTNGSNGQGLVTQDAGATTNGIGSEKPEKARSSKLKPQVEKPSAEKPSNGLKSNGSKAAKSSKVASKSKSSKEKWLGEYDPGEHDDVSASLASEPPEEIEIEEEAVRAAPLPAPESPISFTTTAPPADRPGPRVEEGERSFVRANLVPLILAFVAVCLAVTLVVTILQLGNRNSELASKNALESARSSALAAARTYTVEIASYDYQHLDQDFATVEANSTPSFQRTYSSASGALKALLIKYDSSARATILSAGVVSATTTRVVVVVFLQQTVTNTTQKTAAPTRSQILMTLDYLNGRWLIDDVTTF
jgi:Mce-associated membrane protein